MSPRSLEQKPDSIERVAEIEPRRHVVNPPKPHLISRSAGPVYEK